MLFRDLNLEMQNKLLKSTRNAYNRLVDTSLDTEAILDCTCSKQFKWASMRYHTEDGNSQYFVYCMKCTQIGQLGSTPTEATKLWNAEMLLLQ